MLSGGAGPEDSQLQHCLHTATPDEPGTVGRRGNRPWEAQRYSEWHCLLFSSPGRVSPQQHFWVQRVGEKKKANRYREPGSGQGIISIHLFILQILIHTPSFHRPELSHFLLH